MQIAVQDWMRTPGVAAVFDALSGGVTRFVGGCVRDSLLGRPIRDVDIATDIEPRTVMASGGTGTGGCMWASGRTTCSTARR